VKIALTYNVRPPAGTGGEPDDTYAEWDESETIAAVQSALAVEHEVVLIEAAERAEEDLLEARPDLVFNMAEGLAGPDREARIPAILERLDIPFTGSSSATLTRCLDKAAAKDALRAAGLLTPPCTVVRDAADIRRPAPLPLIVKPLHEGSSKGVFDSSVVTTAGELEAAVRRVVDRYGQPALVEAFLPGREFTVALLGNEPRVTVLPPVEIRFDDLPAGARRVYSYEAKWLWDTPERPLDMFRCPAEVSPGLARAIAALCRRAFVALGCRDWCRIDVRLDEDDRPHVLELNPLPGVLPDPDSHSCFPAAAAAAGLSYGELIRRVVGHACERHGLPRPRPRRGLPRRPYAAGSPRPGA
jgi:D-alanine-D-alanine ligase